MASTAVLHTVTLVGLAHSVPLIILLITRPPVNAQAVADDTQDANSKAQAAVAETL